MGGLLKNAPPPIDDPIAKPRRPEFGVGRDPQEGHISQPWSDYFTSLGTAVNSAPSRVFTVQLSLQGATILATDMTDGAIPAGLYRVSWYARITQAASSSSSLTIGFDWQETGTAQTYTATAMTGNTTTTVQDDIQLLIRVDAGSPVRYSATYSSTGATIMVYSLDITLEEVFA